MLSQELRADLSPEAQAEFGGRVMTQLTGGLLDFLMGLEMTPYRLRIDGAAGCGKTQMVTAFAERWRCDGRRVLVACFNRPLADELRGALPSEVAVETVHGIARGVLAAAGRDADIPSRAADPSFWERLLAEATDLLLADVPAAWRFDALVVDEGQDIQQDGLELLRLLLPEEGDILWLEDENQRLYDTPPVAMRGFVTWRSRDNFRSPLRIARFLQALLPITFIARNPLPGDTVHVQEVARADLLEALGMRVQALCTAGYAPDQIVVVTGRGRASSEVLRADRIGGRSVRRFTGFTPDGVALYSEGELQVETLWRFKGQQTSALILCEFDGDLKDPATARKLYCAATRATMRLEILVARGSSLLPPLRTAAGRANGEQLA
jgi:hypothetical protein